jgi:hypothetical protein
MGFCTMICQRTSCCIFHLTNVMYIGVCDWCENKHMQEVTPSLYAFVKEQDALNARKTFWWVSFNFFFYVWWIWKCKFPSTYNEVTLNNFDVWGIFDWKVYKCHMGWKLGCKVIFWMIQPICLGKVIHDMYEVNIKVWRIIHHVVCTLVGLPYN